MRLGIKQDGGEILTLVKSEAAKGGVLLKEIADKLGLRYDIFVRRLKSRYVDVEFIVKVIKKIDKDLTLDVDRQKNGDVLLTINNFRKWTK